MKLKFAGLIGILVAVALFFWSFSQTDPNLLFINNAQWLVFQNSMWQIPRQVQTAIYILLISLACIAYFLTFRMKKSVSWVIPLVVICGFLLLSNNALSHDIYNYMFNAKAVITYKEDPHIKSALEIAPQDEWVRFMHNVHTTAPYGKLWTYVSLLPSYVGFGKFITTFVSFKLFMALGFILLVLVQRQMKATNVFLFALNPLVLIETFMNGHNDVWMMLLALASFGIALQRKKLLSWQVAVSLVLLLLSTQIKLATFVLVPLWLGIVGLRSKWLHTYWAEIAMILLFIPLVTGRSQQFNPWYLIWPLTFLPFVKVKFVQTLALAFTVTSLFRYIPYLLSHEYTDAIQFQMRLLTWSAIPIGSLVWIVSRRKNA